MSHIFAFGEAFWSVVHPSGTLRGHLEPSFSLLCTCRVRGPGGHSRGEAAHSPLTPLGEICMLLFGWWLLTPNSTLRAAHNPTALMLYYDWASHWPRRTFPHPSSLLQRCCRRSLFTVRSTGSESQHSWFSKSPEVRTVFATGAQYDPRLGPEDSTGREGKPASGNLDQQWPAGGEGGEKRWIWSSGGFRSTLWPQYTLSLKRTLQWGFGGAGNDLQALKGLKSKED